MARGLAALFMVALAFDLAQAAKPALSSTRGNLRLLKKTARTLRRRTNKHHRYMTLDGDSASSNATTNATSSFASAENSTTPSQSASSSSLPEMYRVDKTPDPKGTFKCVEVKSSKIPNAGMGLFAKCDLLEHTTLGEYQGKRFQIGMRGSADELSNDWSYIWKVPKCELGIDKVITRDDKIEWHKCSNEHGFVYVDALPLLEGNPLRYVNGVKGKEDKQNENVDAFFADDRVFYFTTKPMKKGDEFLVDYGDNYWKKAKTDGPEGMDGGDDLGDGADGPGDWGNFVSDN